MPRRRPNRIATSQDTAHCSTHTVSANWIIALLTVCGLSIRIVMILLSPRYGYYQDHDDLARWGLQAEEQGVLTLYDHPPPPADIRIWVDGQYGIGRRDMDRLCNYPPLSVYLLGASGRLYKAISPDRLINTSASRWSVGLWSLLFDPLLAWGCARLVTQLGGVRWRVWAYGLAILAPPMWLVSSLWGQLDTWVLAPAVWMLWAMAAGRWTLAGVLFGIAAGIKPQAVAFVPVWGLALLTIRPFAKPVKGMIAAAVTMLICAIPFFLHSGTAWWRCSYQENLFQHSQGMTTLMAFNFWYLDCLLTGSVDETATWLGLAKSTWGQLGLATALLSGLIFMLRRWGSDPRGLLLWTLWVLLALVMIPTRVHDRFILLVVPFLIVAALRWRMLHVALLLLMITATAQASWPQWLHASSGDWEPFAREEKRNYQAVLDALPPAERAAHPSLDEHLRTLHAEFTKRNAGTRPWEWLFTITGIAGLAFFIWPAVRLAPDDPQAKPPRA